ncbi:hypothetical protein NMY22_g13958 [Coprinellus aureogranulatus]|nr:hypothetical protein NMY22_g13958 [Coprinellus aureogranulatus]
MPERWVERRQDRESSDDGRRNTFFGRTKLALPPAASSDVCPYHLRVIAGLVRSAGVVQWYPSIAVRNEAPAAIDIKHILLSSILISIEASSPARGESAYCGASKR